MDKKFISLFILVLIVGIGVRALTFQYNTFLEPDVYIYYSVAQQTIAHHLAITSQLSAVPYNESPFLIYLPILTSWVLGSLKEAILLLPLIAALTEMLLIYLCAKEMTDNKWAGLTSMFLFAIIVAAILKNSVGEWRGESFVPAFQLLGMWLAIKGFKTKKEWLLVATGAVWILSYFTWNGGGYVLAVAMLFLIFWATDKKVKTFNKALWIGTLIFMVLCLVAWYAYLRPIFNGSPIMSKTILELQTPTFNFIIGAYGLVMPLAIIGLGLLIWQANKTGEDWKKKGIYLVLSLLILTGALQMLQIRFQALLAIPLAILGGIGLEEIYYVASNQGAKKTAYYLLIIILGAQALTLLRQVPFYTPADAINPQFLQAMAWINNNTSLNSTFISMWPDGSVIEGIGNRRSYTDSMMGLNIIRVQGFADYLHAKAGNESYIESTGQDYLVSRWVLQYEAQAVGIEAGLKDNCTYLESNQSNCNFIGTNMNQLISGTAPFPIIYQNNDTIIYKVR